MCVCVCAWKEVACLLQLLLLFFQSPDRSSEWSIRDWTRGALGRSGAAHQTVRFYTSEDTRRRLGSSRRRRHRHCRQDWLYSIVPCTVRTHTRSNIARERDSRAVALLVGAHLTRRTQQQQQQHQQQYRWYVSLMLTALLPSPSRRKMHVHIWAKDKHMLCQRCIAHTHTSYQRISHAQTLQILTLNYTTLFHRYIMCLSSFAVKLSSAFI